MRVACRSTRRVIHQRMLTSLRGLLHCASIPHRQGIDSGTVQTIAIHPGLNVAASQIARATARRLAGRAHARKVSGGRGRRMPHKLRIDPQQLQPLRQQLGRPIVTAIEPAQVVAVQSHIRGDAPQLTWRTSRQFIERSTSAQSPTPGLAQAREEVRCVLDHHYFAPPNSKLLTRRPRSPKNVRLAQKRGTCVCPGGLGDARNRTHL